MALSYHEYTDGGTGTNGLGQNTFSIPFKYISINDVRVRGYNGSTWSDDLTITSDATAKTVRLTGNDPTTDGYTKVRLYRVTTTQALIDFQNGSRLSESDLDTAYQQSLFCAQEVAEAASGLGQPLQGNAGPQGPTGATGATGPQGPTGSSGVTSVAILRDEKPNATVGGTFNNHGWRTRDLNAETDPDGIVTLSNNQFTLGAGTYNIYFTAPAFRVQTHHTRLYNVTDGTVAGNGSNAVQNASAEDSNHSMGWALVTITGNKTFELQHICSTSQANNGFGIAQAGISGNVGLVETYSIVNITKIA